MWAVCAGERSGELCDDVVFTLEDDPSRAVCVGDHAVADFEPRTAESVRGNRDLILGTDPGRTAASFLYVRHNSKGNVAVRCRQEETAVLGEPDSPKAGSISADSTGTRARGRAGELDVGGRTRR